MMLCGIISSSSSSSRRRTSVLAAALLVAFTSVGCGAQSECNPMLELQRLSECALPQLIDAGDGDSLNLHLKPFLLEVSTCSMWTRAYSISKDASATFPGPTIQTHRGSNLRIHVHNHLERGSQVDVDKNEVFNTFHEPNTTNIHLHGMHIEAASPGDDVSIRIAPGDSFNYSYSIPEDHCGGLHYYHAHAHGSTTVQIGGGAVGMLVVADDESNSPYGFLRGLILDERRIMMQHIAAATDLVTPARVAGDDLFRVVEGCISLYLLNGLKNPLLELEINKWTRIRFSHVSISRSLAMAIPDCDMILLAKDGVYIAKPREVEFLEFGPSSRVDIALKCGSSSVIRDTVFQNDLATIQVSQSESEAVAAVLLEMQAWNWIPPPYLRDLRVVQPDAYWSLQADLHARLLNFRSFRGFSPHHSLHNMTLGSVEEWSLSLNVHPVHVHVNHMQLVEDASLWNRAGDWVDAIRGNARIRLRMDRFVGPMVLHCHVSKHAEQGMMGLVYVNDATHNPPQPQTSTSSVPPTAQLPERTQMTEYIDKNVDDDKNLQSSDAGGRRSVAMMTVVMCLFAVNAIL